MSLKPRFPYPVEVVFHPDWWHDRLGLSFDEDFFYHPARRFEAESAMERALYERWGGYGLGAEGSPPQVGAVHLAAGFLLSEMLGCEVEYKEDAPPAVRPADLDAPVVPVEDPFASPAYVRFEALVDGLEERYGRARGDVNWGGVLNIALDLRGQAVFTDLYDRPDEARSFFRGIAATLDRFTSRVSARTGSSSVSVNRIVRCFEEPVFLHSECSHTMVSEAVYDEFLFGFDLDWSRARRPFGVHYCGADPERFAASFARLPRLDFLDLGWGGDVAALRRALPETFFSLRLSPVAIAAMTADEIRATVERLAGASGDPYLTGFCCVNMDRSVPDAAVTALLEATASLRERCSRP